MCQFCERQASQFNIFSDLDDLPGLDELGTLNRLSGRSSLLAGIRLNGTSEPNRLVGTDGADRLEGFAGDDSLRGLNGHDSLLGGGGNDSLFGGKGNDFLNGGSGQDLLVGGAGNDTFKLNRNDGSLVTIQDFQSDRDRLLIDQAGFDLSLKPGSLAPSRFLLGNRAVKRSQRFVYQPTSGQLYFDADGNGPKPKVKIASLAPSSRLKASDIVLSGQAIQSGNRDSSRNGFDINLKFLDNNLSKTQSNLLRDAARRWESIITADVPDVRLANGRVIDDIDVNVRTPSIDGVGGILGQAGPEAIRAGSQLPYLGGIEFDRADLNAAEANQILDELFLHELGHVLGFGTLWQVKGLIVGMGGNNPRYLGKRAVQAYSAVFDQPNTVTSIPLENRGGAGTRDFHWRESVFQNELMSGFLGVGFSPLSRISIAAMADLGYQVNLNRADAFG